MRSAREAVVAPTTPAGPGGRRRPHRLTASTSEAYALLFKLLCDPATGARAAAELSAVRAPDGARVGAGRALHLELPRRRGASTWTPWRAASTPRTRASGRLAEQSHRIVLHRRELDALAELCASRRRGAHRRRSVRRLSAGCRAGVSVLQQSRALAFGLGGLSKSVGLPQVKLAWIGVGGPGRGGRRGPERPEIVADTFLSVSTPVQLALRRCSCRGRVAARANPRPVGRNLAGFARRRRARRPYAAAPRGGWCAVLQVPRSRARRHSCCAARARTACSCTPATSSTSRARPFSSSACSSIRRASTGRRAAARRGRGGGMTRSRRQSGIGVPLFSLVVARSWGIGEFADLPAFGGWCARGRAAFVQLLPLNEISPGETSPYSSMTAMALDPIYIRVPDVADFVALGGEDALTDRTPGAGRCPRRRARAVRRRPRPEDTWLRRPICASSDEELARGTRAGRRRSHAYMRGSRGGSTPTRVSRDPCRPAGAGVVGLAPGLACADAEGGAPGRARLPGSRATAPTSSGSPTEQWHAAAVARGRLAVFGDLPFMVSARQPRRVGAQGRVHARRHASACRPTRSARPARTGACRRGAGT